MFISTSEIRVAPSQMELLESAFADRARLVDQHAGFVGLELVRDIRTVGRYLLITRWRSREHFRAYMKSGDHQRAHDRPHEGLAGHEIAGGNLQQYQVVLSETVDEPL